MNNFEAFKEAFNEKYESIYDFIEETQDTPNELSFGGKLIADLDEEGFNSSGDEDSTLERIFTFEEFGDIHVAFYGTRRSYAGEEWDSFKEVKPVQKTITVYE